MIQETGKALEQKKPASVEVDVTNIDRSFGTIFGSEITKKYNNTLQDDMYTVKCNGAGGQSFGAFHSKRSYNGAYR